MCSHPGAVLLRLSEQEREVLKILNAALRVSEYTDDIDQARSYRKEEGMFRSMSELFTTMVGLSHTAGHVSKDLLDKVSQDGCKMKVLEPVVATAFEVGRRYKRLNPDKMRSEYGKLVMVLQDACATRLSDMLGFQQLVRPVKTVEGALGEIGATPLLKDARLDLATRPLPPRPDAAAIQAKDTARSELVAQFGAGDPAKAATVELCIKSVDDAVTFLGSNQGPVKRLIGWLDKYFGRSEPAQAAFNLAIRNGKGGAMLTHSHEQQWHYVKEAMTLWGIVQGDIFDFWQTVEKDMILSGAGYRFRDTGQGFHRVSSGPATYSRMGQAIADAHRTMGGWVGSKVVHLGDDDVPNPLVFIDKYTIIPRLLSPIVQCIDAIDDAFAEGTPEKYPGYRKLLLMGCDNHRQLQMHILADFFRHGFDGSGDDGGACIDGRLTSAWNWCSQLHKKKFYPVFLLTGFSGFDANYN